MARTPGDRLGDFLQVRFIANMPPSLIRMEACFSAHHLSQKLDVVGIVTTAPNWEPVPGSVGLHHA